MSGGGGAKKLVVNYIVDHPVHIYLGGAAFLYGIRRLQTQ